MTKTITLNEATIINTLDLAIGRYCIDVYI